MNIKVVPVGPLQTNCYVIEDAGEVLVVDPGDEPQAILAALAGRTPVEIVLTHRHWDHIGALADLEDVTGAPTAAFELDCDAIEHPEKGTGSAGPVARRLVEGDQVCVGESVFQVISTPGHTSGSMCLYCADQKVLVAGDTLFAGGSYGRTDFPSGSMKEMVNTLKTKFVDIPDDVVILSGHGPASRFDVERNQNPYLQ